MCDMRFVERDEPSRRRRKPGKKSNIERRSGQYGQTRIMSCFNECDEARTRDWELEEPRTVAYSP